MNKVNIDDIKTILASNSNPLNAEPMAKYMKYRFKYYGLKRPQLKMLVNDKLKEYKSYSTDHLYQLVSLFWEEEEREMQYIALDILRNIISKREIRIEFIEKLITTKSWWDSVDGIAEVNGKYFKNNYDLELLNKWVDSQNIWLNRSAIIFQLKYKNTTDYILLQNIINRLKHKNEFFIQKAIGWTLREYSKTNPNQVLKIVESENLTGLAKREAIRLIK